MAVLLLRGREVGNTSGCGIGSLGKFAFIPLFPLKYNVGAEKGGIFPLKYNAGAEKGRISPLKYNAGTDEGGVFPRAGF